MRDVAWARYRVLFDAAEGTTSWVRKEQAGSRLYAVAKVSRDELPGAIAYAVGAELFAVGL